MHLTLHTVLQYFEVSCHFAVVKHLDLRFQALDDLGTSEVVRESIVRGSLLRVLSDDIWTSWHLLLIYIYMMWKMFINNRKS